MKRLLFLLTPLFLLSCEEEVPVQTDILASIPKSSCLVIESRNIEETLNNFGETRVFQAMDSLSTVLNFNSDLFGLKGSLPSDSLSLFVEDRTFYGSVALSGAGKYDIIFSTLDDGSFGELLKRSLSDQDSFNISSYADVNIIQTGGKGGFYYCSTKGILLLSKSRNLVEECIRQINSGYSIAQNEGFSRVYKTINKKDPANILINLEEFPAWIKHLIPKADISALKVMGNWAALDLQFYNGEMLLAGVVQAGDGASSFTSSFRGISPQTTKAPNIIPENAAIWVDYTFQNAEQYHRNYLNYLESHDRKKRYDQQIADWDFNAEEVLLQWLDTEMGVFHLSGSDEASFAFFKHREEDLCSESLENIADSSFVEGYRGLIIRKLAYENVLSRFHGRLFRGFEKPYFVVLKDFCIFSDQLAGIKGLINDVLSEKTLSNIEAYTDFNSKLPGKAHLKIVVSNPEFLGWLGERLEKRDARELKNHIDRLKTFRFAAVQFDARDENVYTNFYVQYNPQKKEKVSRQWTTVLESPAKGAPQMIFNHHTRKNEVVLFDSNNKMYLINGRGKIMWTRQLDGPVLGEVTQVDFFKNNKLQMVLNTPSSLYVIDRLGRDLENFPVKLPSAATAPVGVFNYDKARNYRLVVPCGKKLYNYDSKGKAVKGWKFKEAKANINTKPQLFSLGKKDLISLFDESGNWYRLNRRGTERFKNEMIISDSHSELFIREGTNLEESDFLMINSEGKLLSIHCDGNIDALFLDSDYPAERFNFFDGKYIFSNGERLIVKSDDNPWSAEFEGDVSGTIKSMIFGGEFYVAGLSKEAEEIRLFNRNGELVDGFPVYSQGSFDMGSLNRDGIINIVTSSEDGTVLCYRVD